MQYLNLLAFICALYFLIAFFLVQIINKRIDFKKNPLSIYALKKRGSVITLGFFLIGINQFIISWLLFINSHSISAIFILLGGLGVCIVGLVKYRNNKSIWSRVHNMGAGMQFLFFPIGLITYSWHTGSSFFSLSTGIITLILFSILSFQHKNYESKKINNFGIIQKINILLINLWLLIFPVYF